MLDNVPEGPRDHRTANLTILVEIRSFSIPTDSPGHRVPKVPQPPCLRGRSAPASWSWRMAQTPTAGLGNQSLFTEVVRDGDRTAPS